jgi:PAS domain S-box-containing protein
MQPTIPTRCPDEAALHILQRSPNAVLAVDEEWRIVYVNDAAARLASRPQSELVGEQLWAVFPAARGTEFELALRRAKDERSTIRVEALYPPAGRWLEACARPIDRGLALYIRDVSARKAAERHAREASELTVLLQQQIEESRALSERLAATNEALRAANDELVSLSVAADAAREIAERAVKERDEVLSMVAHDLKNPLNTIGITLAVLQDLSLSEDDRQRKLEIIENTIGRMDRLIGGLLDMRRLEAGQALTVFPRPIEVDALLQEACGLFRPQIEEKQILLVCEVPESCPAVMADPERIQQVFWNLIGNAVKFTPEGGRVRVACEDQGSQARFQVTDSGPGIAPGDVPRLFDPYWQAKRTARLGTGLGLPIARGIVEAHGGSIEVESTPGEGATFSFALPAALEWQDGDPNRRRRPDRRRGRDRRRT